MYKSDNKAKRISSKPKNSMEIELNKPDNKTSQSESQLSIA